MQKSTLTLLLFLLWAAVAPAQTEPGAGRWKTWFIPSGKAYSLPKPAGYKAEVAQVLARQQALDAAGRQQIHYWNAGAPGYRWYKMVNTLWMNDTSYNGALANLLVGTAIYDATIAAWDSKYAHHRPRPFAVDKRIKCLIPKPESPAYPCEHSVAAGAAATIIAHFYPALADSVQRLAEQVMASRIAAGVAFPSDTRAGFELGQRIARQEIEETQHYTPKMAWDGKRPQEPGLWQGTPSLPLAGRNKTVALDSSSQFRPGPPPDFAKDMAELKAFQPGFRATANAFFFASQSYWDDLLNQKIFEYNLHLNPPRAARLYAISAVGMYDGFAACWDAKYAYWGTRPDQYDTTFQPILIFTPPFPGYPSGHAMLGCVMAELYSDFFPAERVYFQKRAKDGAESRFQGGIHFRTDNEVALEMGKKVAAVIVWKVKDDGAGGALPGGKGAAGGSAAAHREPK
ncbi:MAG: phosphatase PAP2 family protein [Saprospiraceae bacterium]|nr:phosphatase PAP2 family protein [Saprospiraceae bacterium]